MTLKILIIGRLRTYYCMHTHTVGNFVVYCIARKIDRELNLVVWRSAFATTKLKSTNISYLHIYLG